MKTFCIGERFFSKNVREKRIRKMFRVGRVSSFKFIGMPDTAFLLTRIRPIAIGDRIIALRIREKEGELIIRNPEFCARYLDYRLVHAAHQGGLLFVGGLIRSPAHE